MSVDLRSVTPSLEALRHGSPAHALALRIVDCTACSARDEASKPTPFWPREKPASVMLIGRNPGINEDRIGRPFVGRGGELFESWLRGLGISREQIWLTNLIKCYTNADRKPKQREINACWLHHLSKEIEFCRPELIVPLGAEAFAATTGLDTLSQRHGILYDRRDQLGAYVMGCIHPGSALRDASYKALMIQDAKRLKPLLHHCLEQGLSTLPEGYEAQ